MQPTLRHTVAASRNHHHRPTIALAQSHTITMELTAANGAVAVAAPLDDADDDACRNINATQRHTHIHTR